MKFVGLLIVAFVGALGLVACGDDDDDGATITGSATGTPVSVSGSPRVLQDEGFNFDIKEVGLGADGYVALRNYVDVPSSLTGLYLCQPPDCVGLPDVEIQPGEVAVIAVGNGDGLDGVVMTDADLTLTPADGEIALYASEDVENKDDLRVYLQWGLTPHAGTEVAQAAGLWGTGWAPSSAGATRLFRNEGGLWLFDE